MAASIFRLCSHSGKQHIVQGIRNPCPVSLKNILIRADQRNYTIGFEKLKNISKIFKGPAQLRFSKPKANCGLALKLSFWGSSLIGGKLALSTLKVHCEASSLINHDRIEPSLKSNVAEKPLNWSQLWDLLKPQLLYFIGAVITAVIVAIANIQIPVKLGEIVNVLVQSSEIQLEAFLEPMTKIIKTYVVQALGTYLYITCLTRMGERMASDIRKQLFQSLLEQDIAFYDKHKTGELINRLTADVQDFKSSFKMCISQGLRSVAQIIGCGLSMYTISPYMAGAVAIVVPSVVTIGTLLGSLLRKVSKDAQHQVSVATGVAEECLSNIRTVRAFAMEDVELNLFSREVDKSQHLNELLGNGIGLFQAGTNLFLNGVVLGTLYHGGSLLAGGQLTPGGLMAFLVSAQTIQKSLGQLSIMFGTFVRGTSAASRVFEYINTHPTIPLRGGKTIPYHSLLGEVEFDNVSFSYPTRENQKVLKNFSLSLPMGKVVAIVGASGAGKSTIAQLLERFYDVSEGSIKLDGKDIRTLDPTWLRSQALGVINQEPILFATSIKENIRYGRPSASDEEVYAAANHANAHDFISGFPHGYDTVVGERGVTVSGGQKQRIAIARALLKNPSVIILDEATSALDAESESLVQTALETGVQGCTVLVIAHRLCTIQNADVIAVLDKGELVEMGNHETLKKKGGYYAELIKQQQRTGAKLGFWAWLTGSS